ncbi:uncharacterized protein PAC_14251 [Phialocephala subalpina]|uniref:PRISE-like Rossmann-fold domain-containing protein n=1 Tax=Phialocephala subalpina TaxID=576137 RepID=A0A1L7XH25_9HELO|nr:uncharacterized protein PAC_14251 [Phialocephala subalpina]
MLSTLCCFVIVFSWLNIKSFCLLRHGIQEEGILVGFDKQLVLCPELIVLSTLKYVARTHPRRLGNLELGSSQSDPKIPTPTTFSKITGTTNRPLGLEQAFIPAGPRINLVSGVDFTKNVDEVVEALKLKKDDPMETKKANTKLLKTAITAIETVSKKLEFVILQTGAKVFQICFETERSARLNLVLCTYGLEFPDKISIETPLTEGAPRLPLPYANQLVQRGHEAGVSVPFPGSEKGHHSTHSDTSQDILAKMQIFAAVNPQKCGNGQAFNVADGKTVTWAEIWPALCTEFELVGSGPEQGSKAVEDFVRENSISWDGVVARHHLRSGLMEAQNWPFVYLMLVTFNFNR